MSNFLSGEVSELDDGAPLSIGDLAEQTGVAAATLRIWEARHGFPVPHRRASGHRRYDLTHVELVRDVVRRRAEGVRLDVAIEQAVASREVASPLGVPSVFARLRRAHPTLAPHQLRKSTLLALSWAIEDEVCAHPQRAHVFGAFQKARNFEAAEARWNDVARTTTSTYVFADFADGVPASTGGPGFAPRPVHVPLAPDNPMSREWAVVCDGADLPVALTAWELPGQEGVRDFDRIFESMWTVDPTAVRDAARVCALVAADARAPGAQQVVDELAGPHGAGRVDLRQVTSLFNRVIDYVDTPRRHR